MTKQGSVKVDLTRALIREKGTTVSHRPAEIGGTLCKALISEPEQVMVEAQAWPPTDTALCQQCEQAFEEEISRRLGKIYRMAREAARRAESTKDVGRPVD